MESEPGVLRPPAHRGWWLVQPQPPRWEVPRAGGTVWGGVSNRYHLDNQQEARGKSKSSALAGFNQAEGEEGRSKAPPWASGLGRGGLLGRRQPPTEPI
jgi:hypothetical protein